MVAHDVPRVVDHTTAIAGEQATGLNGVEITPRVNTVAAWHDTVRRQGCASGAPWRGPVGLDHQPHREEEDELRGATGAAVVTPDPRGAGRDVTHPDHGAVSAVRAPTLAGF